MAASNAPVPTYRIQLGPDYHLARKYIIDEQFDKILEVRLADQDEMNQPIVAPWPYCLPSDQCVAKDFKKGNYCFHYFCMRLFPYEGALDRGHWDALRWWLGARLRAWDNATGGSLGFRSFEAYTADMMEAGGYPEHVVAVDGPQGRKRSKTI